MRRDGDEELTGDEVDAIRKGLNMDSAPVVTGPGRYKTRGGMEATVIRTNGAFPYSCSGRMGQSTAPTSWAPSGRYRAGGEHPFDLVEKL